MRNPHIEALRRSRTKLVEQRRALVKRDLTSDRADGFAERIVALQTGIEATDRAILDEENIRDLEDALAAVTTPDAA